ncbi:MAG: uroporphyrinogen III methyltransferase [Chloroflexus sp.]|uniref:uroporphyrinogen-III synthase n=1 Tax=Chloroflexus sp. TaxID=1904827 RepID=UPI0021DD0CEA|nr:uroporphyrinogen-III synthase [Chloroflexus sp.]GIV90485.1 MAG: uroporphyrinogen III methyltransferase [Chloroflexus sp.]
MSVLVGRRIAITRPAGRGDTLAARLRALGAIPLLTPLIAYAPPADLAPLQHALAQLAAGTYDWLVVTSRQAVQVLAEATVPTTTAIAAVGKATAADCRRTWGREPAGVPDEELGAALPNVMGTLTGKRVLLPCADIAPSTLTAALQAAGAIVDRVTAYRTISSPAAAELAAALRSGTIDAIVLASGSAARQIPALLPPQTQCPPLVCIGPSTAAVCTELGLPVAAIATRPNDDALLAALERVFLGQDVQPVSGF